MSYHEIHNLDLAGLSISSGYTHPQGFCKIHAITLDGAPFQVLFKDLRVHPFAVSSFPEQRQPKLSLTTASPFEKRFFKDMEQRLQQCVDELDQNTMFNQVPRRRGSLAEPPTVRILCADPRRDPYPEPIPRVQVNLPQLVTKTPNGNSVQHDRFRFTIRNGLTNEIMTDVLPSHPNLNEVFKSHDHLVAILRFDSVIFYGPGPSTTIRITLFQAKLYPKATLHQLPIGHRFYEPPPGMFTMDDLLTDDTLRTQPPMALPVAEREIYIDDIDTDTDDTNTTEAISPATYICSVCMVTSVNSSLNCGHTLCMTCAYQVEQCPHCRATITERRPIYLV